MKSRAVHFNLWEESDIAIRKHCLHKGDYSYWINVAIKEWLERQEATEPQPTQIRPEEGTVSER